MRNIQKPYRIADLIHKELKQTITAEEKKELDIWLNEKKENNKLFDKIKDSKNLVVRLKLYDRLDEQRAWMNFNSKLNKLSSRSAFIKSGVFRYAAAILILAAAGYGIFQLKLRSDTEQDDLVVRKTEINPGSQVAVLTLSDGKTVDLGKQKNKLKITDGGTEISDSANALKYLPSKSSAYHKEVMINTLETPRGGEYTTILCDGSLVQLNADTKLTFPVSFSDSIRSVKLSGEAYFEVAKSDIPFIIKTEHIEVEVLGTSFNITSYPDEQIVKTTLVSGSVAIKAKGKSGIQNIKLEPDEQAVWNERGFMKKKVDAELYTAWTRGRFMFEKTSLRSVMNTLSRWYDFELVCEYTELDHIHFSGKIKRYDEIKNILNKLEMTTNEISFEIHNDTVKILAIE